MVREINEIILTCKETWDLEKIQFICVCVEETNIENVLILFPGIKQRSYGDVMTVWGIQSVIS